MNRIKEFFYRKFRTSFSKSGEDIMLYQLLKNTKHKFYIDVGAHNPRIHSNSYFFYLRGWKGICIEPNPIFLDEWKKFRPKDQFSNIGISESNSNLDYFIFKESVRNTFSKDYIKEFDLESRVLDKIKIKTTPLKEVLEELKVHDQPIGFLSVDCEGYDLEVLKSNDWNKFRPEYILIESFNNLEDDISSPSVSFLESKNYQLIGKAIQYQNLSDTIGSLLFKVKKI